jgi:hypothetical protein
MSSSLQTHNCQNCKNNFTITSEDFSFYEKMQIPPPTFCPLCRAQRRFTFRNERALYKVKSAFSSNEIVSMFSPTSGVQVYENDAWQGDAWDPLSYGVDYDFSRPFFEQFFELFKRVPLRNRGVVFEVNSPYVNHASSPKNSYLVFNAKAPEECLYGHGINQSRSCMDVSHISESEFCYEGFWLTECSNCIFSSQCQNSFNLQFSKNCVGCNDCFGCVNLRKKSYCIFNKQYTKEEYREKIESFNIGSYTNLIEMKTQVLNFWKQFPNKYIEGLHNDTVSGNYIDHSKDVYASFLVRESRNMRYCQYVQELPGSEDCMDYSVWGDNNRLVYESHACGIGTSNIKFCMLCQEDVHDLEYCMFCTRGSANLFGCVGIKKKEYCILNKQYTKEEYELLIPKIKEHMMSMPYKDKEGKVYTYGEFFPSECSSVSYNTTLAQEYFPLTKDEARSKGFFWEDDVERGYAIDITNNDLPDHIDNVSDDILGKVIECAHKGDCNQLCTTAFKIIPDELALYRKFGVSLPRLCSNCRTFERLKQRTGLQQYVRVCMHEGCTNAFSTTYNPADGDIVYCESCYQQEVE